MLREARIHLLSVAGSDRDLPQRLGLEDARALRAFVRDCVGGDFEVSATPELLGTVIDQHRGGRDDDARRVAELEQCLGDDGIVALVALRGGAWLTRILGEVDFQVLERRQRPLSLFGFSEMTTLINIAGHYPAVRAFYDLGPSYLQVSLQRQARENIADIGSAADPPFDPACETPDDFARRWARSRFRAAFAEFFHDVGHMLQGSGSSRPLGGELLSGDVPERFELEVVGGCLAVMVTLCGSRFQDSIDTTGRWLALEDTREEPYRLDRYLAQLKLAGLLQRCAGLLLGDFNCDGQDQTAALLELLQYHVPPACHLPIVGRCNFGHRPCVAPLPIHQRLRAIRTDAGTQRPKLLFQPL